MRARQIPLIAYLVALGVFVFIVWYIMDESHLSETSMLTRRPVAMTLFFIAVFLVPLIIPIYEAKIRSPVVDWPGGHGTYDPRKADYIYPPKGKGGKRLPYKFFAVPLGSFKALKFYQKGGGRHGVKVVLDLPGMVVKAGNNLHLNIETETLYTGRDAKKKIWYIHERLYDYADMYGFKYDVDTPVWVSVTPASYLKYDEEIVQEITGWWESEQRWSDEVKDLSDKLELAGQEIEGLRRQKARDAGGFWGGLGRHDEVDRMERVRAENRQRDEY